MHEVVHEFGASPPQQPDETRPHLEVHTNDQAPDPSNADRPNLCVIVPLPTPEFIDQSEFPPQNELKSAKASNKSSLDSVNLQKMFEARNESTAESRTRDLLMLAWQQDIEDIPVIPDELIPYVSDDLATWFEENLDRVQLPENSVESLKYYTDQLNDKSSFLKNAIKINKKSWGRKEGRLTEASARLILLDAIKALEKAE